MLGSVTLSQNRPKGYVAVTRYLRSLHRTSYEFSGREMSSSLFSIIFFFLFFLNSVCLAKDNSLFLSILWSWAEKFHQWSSNEKNLLLFKQSNLSYFLLDETNFLNNFWSFVFEVSFLLRSLRRNWFVQTFVLVKINRFAFHYHTESWSLVSSRSAKQKRVSKVINRGFPPSVSELKFVRLFSPVLSQSW